MTRTPASTVEYDWYDRIMDAETQGELDTILENAKKILGPVTYPRLVAFADQKGKQTIPGAGT